MSSAISLERGLYAAACFVTVISVLRPFWAAKYPPITDLPFHAAETSVFRHYGDPAFHFREQFELQPFAVPYLSSYVLGALLMLILPALTAVKLATAIMLLTLPCGLGTLAWGMRKTPLLGLAALPLVWSNLTHWGFINFVAAIGLFAAALGLTLRAVDKPSRRTTIALGVVMVLLLTTHVFRFPFVVLAVGATTAVMYPLTKRARPVLIAALPAILMFAIFWRLRPAELASSFELTFDTKRLDGFWGYLTGSFAGDEEKALARDHGFTLAAVAAVSLGHAIALRHERSRRELCFSRLAALAPAMSAAGFLLAFLVLPMEAGDWWYIFPREALATCFAALGLVPDLPRERWLRAGCVALLSISAMRVSSFVSREYAAFESATRDFDAISAQIPQAPKLAYLVFDRSGSSRGPTVFMHLPAYVQAEKGGWLSFHFAVWGTSPIRYRTGPGAVVPPPVPKRWEWTPQVFDVREHGQFFDWFLIRSANDPFKVVRADPSSVFVDRRGSWWLYKRR